MIKRFLFIWIILFSIEGTLGQIKSRDILKVNNKETSLENELQQPIMFDLRSKKKCRKSFKKTDKMISNENELINCLKELERSTIYQNL